MSILFTVAAFIVAIAILVVVHEFGHYWVARRLGVKVLRFSVGFGRPLWMRRLGVDRTEWVVAAIPLGGYVKMLDEREGKVAKKDVARAFNRQSLWKRSAIVLAGPAFNLLFAVLAYWVLYTVGLDGVRPVVGQVAAGSIAAAAGFEPGDEITAIDGKAVASWDQRRLYLFQRALRRDTVEVEVRTADGGGATRRLDLSSMTAGRLSAGMLEKEIGLSGYRPDVPPVIDTVTAGGPAAQAGIEVGDRVLAIDGVPVADWEGFVKIVSASPGRVLRMKVERDGAQRVIEVTPARAERDGETVGRIEAGVRVPDLPESMRVTVRMNPWAAAGEAVEHTWLMSALTLQMLYKMLVLEVSTKTISGPITIAQYAGHSARIGLDRFLMFLAVVSISLGILNLLPIPILDGGHLLTYLIEAVKGSPLSDRAMQWGQQLGIAMLLTLMALAFYNDFARLLQ
ncbi:MAG TPA: RIP metalloprotease RseP [Acidiferrobacterales bacterium]